MVIIPPTFRTDFKTALTTDCSLGIFLIDRKGRNTRNNLKLRETTDELDFCPSVMRLKEKYHYLNTDIHISNETR